MAPQIIYLSIIFVNLLLIANQHGKERKGKHNIWISLISAVLTILLLLWGGFFNIFIK